MNTVSPAASSRDPQAQPVVQPIAPSASEAEIDLASLLNTLWRGKWFIGLCAAVAIVLGGYYAFAVAVPTYTSTAVVKLETQQANIVDLESVMGGFGGNFMEVNSEVEVLRSRSLMGKVVDRLDLTLDPEFNAALRAPSSASMVSRVIRSVLGSSATPTASQRSPEEQARRTRDRTINTLLRRVSVGNVSRSLVFNITVTTEDPFKSALIADTVAELYILEQLEVKFEATEQATEWLTGRVTELQSQLELSEAKVADFSASIDLISVEALQAQEIQLKDMRDRAADAQVAVLAAQERLTALQSATEREAQAQQAQDVQLTRLLARAQSDASIAQAFDTRFAQVLARAELDVTRLRQQVTALEASLVEQEALIDRQGTDLITLQQLSREAEAVGLLYETFLRRLQETSAQQGIQQADSRILSKAVLPVGPSAPRKSLILAMSMMLGLMLGAGLVLLREMRQNGFRTAKDLEDHTGYTVLGQIPRIPSRHRKGTLDYLLKKPSSAAAEAYRNLRTSLMLSNVDNPPQVIVSTSCMPGEGKTTNSLALAQNLTGLGQKVLLIEGDIRRRTFTNYFKDIPEKALVSVISGEVSLEEALVKDDSLQAQVLAGEKTSANAADIFASQKFRNLIEELRDQFDTIIIDTPPVLVVPDARLIAEVSDAVLFTVKWDVTSKVQVAEAMRMFHSSGQRITGFVLSQINARRMRSYGYGGSYGAYGAYGSYGSRYYDN